MVHRIGSGLGEEVGQPPACPWLTGSPLYLQYDSLGIVEPFCKLTQSVLEGEFLPDVSAADRTPPSPGLWVRRASSTLAQVQVIKRGLPNKRSDVISR